MFEEMMQGTLCFAAALFAVALLGIVAALVCASGWIQAACKYDEIMARCEELLNERDDAQRACEVYRMSHRAARIKEGGAK